MTYNVCRPITLYNDFLPSGKKPHKEWDYLAFGYFDGIKVGEENLFINSQCSMKRIWDYDMCQTENLQGTYSQQTIYGFRAEDDTEFWKEAKREKTEYPFLFVVLLQNKIDESKAAIKRRIKIEKGLSLDGKRKAITYLTLDNSGMVMIFMCRTYGDGASIIDSFHRDKNQGILKDLGVELSYSFTVAAVQKKFISGDDIRKLNACKLKSAYIYGIEKYPGSIEVIYNKVKKILKDSSVEKESILGCNDEVVVIKDASWTEFLELYRDSTGVLNHSSLEYNSSVIGLTTIITQEQNDFESADNKSEEKKPGNEQTLSQIMRTRIQQKDTWNQKAGSTYLNRYLYQVINALQKFENMIIPDYIFCSMFLPIDMVLDIAENVTEDVEKSFVKCFHEFVKGLNLCVQNSIRSDRQFTQSLAFDIQIYSTPVRLNAFYNAFIYYMKNFLQWLGGQPSVRHRYEFLASVGVTDKIQVYELFKNISRKNFFRSVGY